MAWGVWLVDCRGAAHRLVCLVVQVFATIWDAGCGVEMRGHSR
jgi:hypothetical protein